MTQERYDELHQQWVDGDMDDSHFIERLREHVETSFVKPAKTDWLAETAKDFMGVLVNGAMSNGTVTDPPVAAKNAIVLAEALQFELAKKRGVL